jgi:hypothetical protein
MVSKYWACSGDPKNCRCIGRGEWFLASFKRVRRALSQLFFVCAALAAVWFELSCPGQWSARWSGVGASPDAIPVSNANAVPFQVTVTTSGGAILVRRGLVGPGWRWRYSAEFWFAIFDPRRALLKASVVVADAVDYAYAVVGNE